MALSATVCSPAVANACWVVAVVPAFWSAVNAPVKFQSHVRFVIMGFPVDVDVKLKVCGLVTGANVKFAFGGVARADAGSAAALSTTRAPSASRVIEFKASPPVSESAPAEGLNGSFEAKLSTAVEAGKPLCDQAHSPGAAASPRPGR